MAILDPQDLIELLIEIHQLEMSGRHVSRSLSADFASSMTAYAESDRLQRAFRNALYEPGALHANYLADLLDYLDRYLTRVISTAKEDAENAEGAIPRLDIVMTASGAAMFGTGGLAGAAVFGSALVPVAPVVLGLGFIATSVIFAGAWSNQRLAVKLKARKNREARDAQSFLNYLIPTRANG